MRLEGKRAVVLGAAGANNMGQVIARRLIAEGASVLVAGRKPEHLEAFVAAHPGKGFMALCDITRKADNEALAKSAAEQMGGVDIAVNATGWGLLKPFLETTEDELQRIGDLQFKGPFLFFQAMIEAMAQGGSLIQISSATATIMLNDHAAYMGTKAGTDHVIRCIANEFGARGIKANSISPGLTETPMTAANGRTPGLWEAFVPSYPMGRVGTSDDIAAAVVWLASDECFMTGQNLQVNGGLTLRRNPWKHEIEASVVAAMQQLST
ncbi:SDR family oxidoreductase [Novosphingobium sp. KCTC 2891]|uniref:SDR family NAD(P)-dependent oxidoreductase n=1 Tax=Novosphingobium sp. KCTC 2891 TaxID=2989730 RepID=UPI0022233817|nr:SDR family oxidoreductase [Novosphingobium sp. KCTC 2891]MCW1382937.1 SDR family oxidoreductase [Novosphingobium sp. KCTC 2891]